MRRQGASWRRPRARARPGMPPTARAPPGRRPSRSAGRCRDEPVAKPIEARSGTKVTWGAVLRPGRALLSSPLAGRRPGGPAIEILHVGERVDLLGRLVVPQPHDPRKPQGESRGLPPAHHDLVQRDRENDPRTPPPAAAETPHRAG